jgi:helicase SWR1
MKFFELKAGNGERERKIEEKRLRKLAKDTADRVVKQWKAVREILSAKHKQLVALDEKAIGKHHMNQIIENSTKVLQDQKIELEGGNESSADESEDEGEDLGVLMDDDMEIDEEDIAEDFAPVIVTPQSSDIEDDEGSQMEENGSQADEEDGDSDAMEMVQEESEDELSTKAAELIPPLIKGGTLRIYQLNGLKWLLGLHNKGLNGILADEMVWSKLLT